MPSELEINNRFSDVDKNERENLGRELFELITSKSFKEDSANLNKVKDLLLRGADTEVANEYGYTGLMKCIINELFATFRMYMLCGCDINHKNRYGQTPLILCSDMYNYRYNANRLADMLIDSGCSIDDVGIDGSALNIAKRGSNFYLVKRLESILEKDKGDESLGKAKRLIR